jgi:phospholipid-binding lipoprotein MlaA
MRRSTLAALVGAMFVSGAPAALAQGAHAPGDPWERVNRVAYAIQDRLNRVLFHPLGVVFRHLAPGPLGKGVHNVLVNLSEPGAFVNDLLQARVHRAGVSAARFITNSTVGLLGIFDVAGHAGLAHQDNEFGVTLGRMGVKSGPYMYVVLMGPTTVRDLIGSGVDFFIDPLHWVRFANQSEVSYARIVVGGLDKQVMTEDQLKALLADATDPYATLRSVYLQNKEGEIEGGGLPVDNLPSFDDEPPAAAPAAPAPEAPAPAQPPAAAPAPGPAAALAAPATPETAPVDEASATPIASHWAMRIQAYESASDGPAATLTAANDRTPLAPTVVAGDQ